MKGDFTRQTFRARNHYRGVLQQQGRVQLDADWNEQVLLQDHRDRLVTRDTIGPHGAPEHHAGMAIAAKDGTPLTGPVPANKLWISPGRFYVHGILLENEEAIRLIDQPDLPGVPLQDKTGHYIAFLDVWHRLLTSAEEPSLREVALGGPDTATRSKTVWQVQVRPEEEAQPPRIGSGQLRARAHASGPVTSPCDAPTGTGFRRLDNQLYRVEIRDADRDRNGYPQQATYLWSRENGSVTARLLKLNGDDLVLDSIGRDGRLSFDKGWVEVTSPGQVLRGEPGFLGSIGHVQGNTVTVTWDGAQPADNFDVDGAIVRRWESGALPVRLPADPENDWIDLESGVQIQFDNAGFRTGDYWLIPARTANLEGVPAEPGLAGNVDWPQDAHGAEYLGPEGIRHFYADIAELVLGDDGWTVTDLRPVFPPITEMVQVGYAGGDGQQVLAGSTLPQPLEVSVTSHGHGVPGATVHFHAVNENGRLAASRDDAATSGKRDLDATANQDGIAQCWWWPAPGTEADELRVIADYAGSDGKGTDPLIDFSAAFAEASGVAFAPPADCTWLAGADTVQKAIDTLAATAVLVPNSGDGQNGQAETVLDKPVVVQVRTGCGHPVEGAMVAFSVASGVVTGPTETGTSTNVPTDRDGLASCRWQLGGDIPVQTLTATLLAGTAPNLAPDPAVEPVTFVAGVLPHRHVIGVGMIRSGAALSNDDTVAATDLDEGLTVTLDGAPALAVDGKPVLSVTLHLPYPLSSADRDSWGVPVVGTVPVTLAGSVAGNGPEVTWTPASASQAVLDRLFTVLAGAPLDGRVLCRLALDGWVTGGPAYTQWNWLVARVAGLVVIPQRSTKLDLPSGRSMLAHSISRPAIQAALPAGIQINDEPAQDLGIARRAAGNAFRNGADRRLVLVVAESYAAAARVIANALTDAVKVSLEVVPAADPVAAAGSRMAADQPVDGILTDDASAAAVTALPDFPVAYPL